MKESWKKHEKPKITETHSSNSRNPAELFSEAKAHHRGILFERLGLLLACGLGLNEDCQEACIHMNTPN